MAPRGEGMRRCGRKLTPNSQNSEILFFKKFFKKNSHRACARGGLYIDPPLVDIINVLTVANNIVNKSNKGSFMKSSNYLRQLLIYRVYSK